MATPADPQSPDSSDEYVGKTWADPLPREDGYSPPTTVDGVTVYAPRLARTADQGGLLDPNLDDTIAKARVGFGGFVDTASMGLFDLAASAVNAFLGKGGHGQWADRFRNNLAAEQAQDEADLAAHPWSRRAGQGVGLVAGLIAPEAMGVAGAFRAAGLARAATVASTETAARAASMAPASVREAQAILDGARAAAGRRGWGINHVVHLGAAQGAVAGLVGQGASDVISGHLSSPQHYFGAAAGAGVAGATAPFVGPVLGGGLVGIGVPTAQAFLQGRLPNPNDLYSQALSGMVAGRLASASAEHYVDGLSSKQKGDLGEALSSARAYANGEFNQTPHQLKPVPGFKRGTFVDIETAKRLIEAKFGQWARLSKPQRAAANGALDNYEVEWWHKRDVGDMAGVGAASVSAERGHQ